jgi:DNA (cytosine-5)-methyltransferase 1
VGRAERALSEPSVSITSRADLCSWTNGSESRPLTQAEAAVLQSMPADYPWQGTKTKQFEQIGNMVPALLAAHAVSAVTGIPLKASALVTAA